MRQSGRISSYSVNKKHISIKVDLLGDVTPATIEELQGSKGKTKTLRLDTLQLAGEIASINMGSSTGFLVHTGKYDFINSTLFNILNKDAAIEVYVSDKSEDKILLFLDEAAKLEGKKRALLLYELTSFRHVKGKKSVFHLSDEQKKVVLDKLNRIIHKKSGPAANTPEL